MSQFHSLSELTRQIAPPTKNGHSGEPPTELRKSYQFVSPYCVWVGWTDKLKHSWTIVPLEVMIPAPYFMTSIIYIHSYIPQSNVSLILAVKGTSGTNETRWILLQITNVQYNLGFPIHGCWDMSNDRSTNINIRSTKKHIVLIKENKLFLCYTLSETVVTICLFIDEGCSSWGKNIEKAWVS